ncbi:unnamed protein product [Sphagnum balticum]
MGVTLDGNAQPVDFFFSNTPVASGNSIVPGQYYAVTVKRSGSADQCDILIATGGSYSNTSWVTTFNGSLWVDIPEQELWFRVWTDAAKVSDGQAYETGHGVIIPKTQLDPITNTTVDYYLTGIPFTGNELYTAVVEATVKQSGTVQDQRTGVTAEVFPAPPSFDPGLINTFIPNNLIIGSGGNFLNEDESFYKVDFEIGTIILEIPDGFFGIERTIDIFGDFVADYTGAGVTRLGYPALRFSDGTFVQNTALTNSQVQFSASVQSFSPNINGLDPDGYTGAIVDGKIGVSMDYGTGLLTLNFTNLYQDSVLQTLNTKIQVNVFVKKGGFNNVPIFVNSDKVQNMLELISVFSGAGTNGGPIVMVDLATETFGELPSPSVAYEPAAPSNWAGTPPNNLQDALDRVAAALSALSHKP